MSRFLSVGSDHKDRNFAQIAEDIGDHAVLTVIPPDHPDSTARRCLSEHLVGAVLPLLKAKDAVERCLDLFSREGVGVNLL